MSSFRRWYFYIVAAVSLQAVTWAVIALLRNLIEPALGLLDPRLSPQAERIAFQIAVIIVGLPMFLLHWRWANRADSEEAAEFGLPERYLYLYVMLSAFLFPLLANTNGFLQSLLRTLSGTSLSEAQFAQRPSEPAFLVSTGIAMLVLSLMIAYHARLLRREHQRAPDSALLADLHRLFIYLFSLVGLGMTSFGAVNLLRGLFAAGSVKAELLLSRQLVSSTATLIVGAVLWLLFWRAAQRLYRSNTAEQASLLRKAYLYLVIFLAILSTVGAATALLAGFFRRLLDLEPQSGSGMVVSTLIVGGLVWAYHALVLREDTRDMPLQEEQAGLRRLYWYLVAGIGLLALLVGLGGLLGVLFDTSGYIVTQQRENLAWFASALLAGLLVWIVPWRLIQRETADPPPAGTIARTSVVRRFYLYFFLLLATLTFLICAIFILSRLLTLLLGEPLQPGDGRDISLAAAYALMAGVVWLYHGWLLRQDRHVLEAQQAQRAAAMRLVVVDDGDGRLGRHLYESLREAIPGAHIMPLPLTPGAAEAMQLAPDSNATDQLLAAADLIIGPWTMAAPHAGLSADESIQAAIAASPARRLLLPRPAPGWEWAGLEPWQEETAVRQATAAAAQIVAGETAALRRPLTAGRVLLLIIATLVILFLITSLLGSVLPMF